MLFTAPMTFGEALQSLAMRNLLPTSALTADMRQFSAEIRRRSLWSATLESVNTLQKISGSVQNILQGKTGVTDGMLALRESLEKDGYIAPEGKEGTLQDLLSPQRRRLVIETQADMAANAGRHAQGMTPAVLEEFPAQELYRIGTPAGGSEAERDWGQRWIDAGGPPAIGGRMIALKTDPVWTELGNPALFPDGLGNPWPPYAFHSLMRVRDIDRDEAVALGIMDPDTILDPGEAPFGDEELAAAPATRAQWLREAIEDSGLAAFDADGVLHFLANDYDPAQPRADDGRWSETGDTRPGSPAPHRRRDSLGRRPARGEQHLPDDDNIARGRAAIQRLQRRKSGSIRDAMFVKDLGTIEFAHGNTGIKKPDTKGRTHREGGGVAHIDSKHAADLLHVPEWIVKGEKGEPELATIKAWNGKEMTDRQVWKREINYKGNLVILSSRSKGSKSQWLVTGFNPARGSK
ncbi:MAG: hypothetical protein LBK99_24505 [Opitutaceae bacterium]|jgi:hypothetical protein|nr:hypothetical protein [Opitutaceae bacterium]